MATLEHSSTGARYIPSSSYLIGRSRACALRCENPRASAEHAVLRWTGDSWEVRDLASRNGTFVEHERLASGQSVGVKAGARLAFGDPTDIFHIVDDAPPVMCARARTGAIILAEDGVLAIPSADDYQFLVVADERAGGWRVEPISGNSRPVQDQEILHAGADYWYLDLPVVIGRTRPAHGEDMQLADIHLLIEVHDKFAHNIDITIIHENGRLTLPHRANADLLLVLAQERLRDARCAGLSACEHGWIEREALIERLTESRESVMTAERLSVEIYRARNQFRAARVRDAGELIERSAAPPPRVRLGTGKVEIVTRYRKRVSA